MNELFVDLVFCIGLLEGTLITLGLLFAFGRLQFKEKTYWCPRCEDMFNSKHICFKQN